MARIGNVLRTTAMAGALLAPVAASAHWFSASGLYVGAGAGRAYNRGANTGMPGVFVRYNRTHTSWKAYLGWAFDRFFAIQAGYQNLGTTTASTPIGSEHIRNRGYDLNGLVSFPFTPQFSLFIEGGASRFRTRTMTPVSTTITHEGTHPDYGAGVQYYFIRHVAIRGQWQEFRIPNNNTQVYSGSLLVRF
jgi:hypothetical protein